MPLSTAIDRRVSIRDYSAAPVSLAELSWLLWCTQGVKEVFSGQATLRTVPSDVHRTRDIFSTPTEEGVLTRTK